MGIIWIVSYFRVSVAVPAGAADVLQAVQADAGEEVPSRPQDTGAAGEHPPAQNSQPQVGGGAEELLL